MSVLCRIATFNLESLDDRPDIDPPLAERIAVLYPQLQRLAADILCLQEVNGQHPPGGGPRLLLALDKLLAGTPYADYHRASSHRIWGQARSTEEVADVHNLVILSRFPIRDCMEIRHDLVPPIAYRQITAQPPASDPAAIEWDRPVLAVSVELPGGRRLHAVNLHLRAPLAAPIAGQKQAALSWKSAAGWAEGFFLATMKRAGQALEVRLLVDRLFDADTEALIAVCGDFNAEERQMPLRTLRGDVEDTGNKGLADRVLIPLEQTLPKSQRFSVMHGGRKAMLDHLLVSPALLACYRHVEVHNEALGDELFDHMAGDVGPESYHAPVVAEFALPDD